MLLLGMTVFLTCMVMTAVITDITSYIIPNLLVLIILLVYPIVLFTAPAMPDWKWGLIAGGGTFLVGFILFAFKAMGGGDVKFLSVIALFAGKDAFPEFIMLVALLGGLLSIMLLAMRPITSYAYSKLGKPSSSMPRILTTDAPIPYGVAIGLAFIYLIWTGRIAGIAL